MKCNHVFVHEKWCRAEADKCVCQPRIDLSATTYTQSNGGNPLNIESEPVRWFTDEMADKLPDPPIPKPPVARIFTFDPMIVPCPVCKTRGTKHIHLLY